MLISITHMGLCLFSVTSHIICMVGWLFFDRGKCLVKLKEIKEHTMTEYDYLKDKSKVRGDF